MSVIATAVRHLMAAGVTGDALLAAIEELEADVRAEPKPRSAGAIRTERWRNNQRHKASQVTEGDACDGSDADPSLSLPPNEINSNPPAHSHPEKQTPRARKGHRLPDDWQPGPLPVELATAVAAWPAGALERELARFRDWAASATGPNAVKSNWDAAWRNWLRKAQDEGRYGERSKQLGSIGSRSFDGRDGVARALDRQLGLGEPAGSTGRRDAGEGGDYRALPAPRLAAL